MDDEKKELLKKISSAALIIIIIIGAFLYLHAPPGPLKSRSIDDYKKADWEKYATPFFSFYYPNEYTVDDNMLSQNQTGIAIKMPDNRIAANISFQPHAVTGNKKFSLSTNIPKNKFKSGFINDCKVWVFEEPTIDGRLVVILEKNRQSITATGNYSDTFGRSDGLTLNQQRKNLLMIIESIRFSNF